VKASSPSVNWSDWLQRWDRQQSGYLPERERRFAWRDRDFPEPTLELHEAALRNASFREVGVVWQQMDDRVILGVR
jgi:hypothetical protein